MRARDTTVTLRPQGSVTVKFTADRGGDHLGALLGLGGELHVIGDPGVLAPGRVRAPCLWTVEAEVEGGGRGRSHTR